MEEIKPKKKYNYTKKTGRPTDYKPEYCKAIIDFFNIEPYKEIVKKKYTRKDGETIEEFERQANDMRFLSQFARSIGVSHETLHNWCKQHPDFLVAYNSAKELQAEHLITNGLHATFNPFFAFQTAKNIIGWRDKQDEEVPEKLIENELEFPTIPSNGDGKERLKQYFN